ncbi:MAG TPA: DUF4287 domain-containing protein [Gammaproteobacteria bacterium]|nr:DUF4287 domain-containing protein [Gammaproteobacteria bacterium]
MGTIEKAVATQLANIEKRTGKSLAELGAVVAASGLVKHGELVAMLKRDLGMGHGDANTLVHTLRKQAEGGAVPAEDAVAAFYTGKKEVLRPIHDRLMAAIRKFGPFEEAPKKTYVSLRRKKQFATIGPATNTQVEVGLNVKGLATTARLVQLPPKGMCDYKVRLSAPAEVDAALVGWLRKAYDAAG